MPRRLGGQTVNELNEGRRRRQRQVALEKVVLQGIADNSRWQEEEKCQSETERVEPRVAGKERLGIKNKEKTPSKNNTPKRHQLQAEKSDSSSRWRKVKTILKVTISEARARTFHQEQVEKKQALEQKMRQEKEEHFSNTHPFHPEICDRSAQLAVAKRQRVKSGSPASRTTRRPYVPVRAKETEISQAEFRAFLRRNADFLTQKRAHCFAGVAKRDRDELEKCTFHPQCTHNPNVQVKNSTERERDIFEALYNEAMESRRVREYVTFQQQQAKERHEMDRCTFWPCTTDFKPSRGCVVRQAEPETSSYVDIFFARKEKQDKHREELAKLRVVVPEHAKRKKPMPYADSTATPPRPPGMPYPRGKAREELHDDLTFSSTAEASFPDIITCIKSMHKLLHLNRE